MGSNSGQPPDWSHTGPNERPRTKRKTQPSPLVDRLFDEAGDRLTPSHSKTKVGTRLRYYISHRLVTQSGEGAKDGWRLPASELENSVEKLARGHLGREVSVLNVVSGSLAAEVPALKDRLEAFLASAQMKDILDLVERVDIAPAAITITLCPKAISECLAIDPERLAKDLQVIRAPFRIRKRGVETRIIMNGDARPVDQVLFGNIASANAWYRMIKSGNSFADISRDTGTSKRRIQQMLDLAFLAPDIIRQVMEGRQPLGFTSDWCLRHDLPSDWQVQRDLVATL